MVIRRPIRVYSNIGPQLAAKRPAVSSSRRRRSPRRPRPSRLLSPTQPTLSTAHLRPRALTHIRRVGIPPPTPANNARTSGETARRRLVAAGEVGGQVGAQGHQSTAAEGMARPSRRRCRRAEPSAAGRGNLRPACAGQKLWPPMEAGRAGGRGPAGGGSPLETLAADPPPLPTGRPPRAGKAIAMGGGRSAHPVPARGAPAARPAICERAGGAAVAAVAEQRSRGEVGGGGEGGARNGGCCCNGWGRDGRRGGCLTYARWSWVYVKRPGGTSVAPTPKQQHPPSPTFRTGQTHRTQAMLDSRCSYSPREA